MAVALDALSSKPVLLHPTSAGSASLRESVTPESEQMVSSTFDAPYTIVKDLLSDLRVIQLQADTDIGNLNRYHSLSLLVLESEKPVEISRGIPCKDPARGLMLPLRQQVFSPLGSSQDTRSNLDTLCNREPQRSCPLAGPL